MCLFANLTRRRASTLPVSMYSTTLPLKSHKGTLNWYCCLECNIEAMPRKVECNIETMPTKVGISLKMQFDLVENYNFLLRKESWCGVGRTVPLLGKLSFVFLREFNTLHSLPCAKAESGRWGFSVSFVSFPLCAWGLLGFQFWMPALRVRLCYFILIYPYAHLKINILLYTFRDSS